MDAERLRQKADQLRTIDPRQTELDPNQLFFLQRDGAFALLTREMAIDQDGEPTNLFLLTVQGDLVGRMLLAEEFKRALGAPFEKSESLHTDQEDSYAWKTIFKSGKTIVALNPDLFLGPVDPKVTTDHAKTIAFNHARTQVETEDLFLALLEIPESRAVFERLGYNPGDLAKELRKKLRWGNDRQLQEPDEVRFTESVREITDVVVGIAHEFNSPEITPIPFLMVAINKTDRHDPHFWEKFPLDVDWKRIYNRARQEVLRQSNHNTG